MTYWFEGTIIYFQEKKTKTCNENRIIYNCVACTFMLWLFPPVIYNKGKRAQQD